MVTKVLDNDKIKVLNAKVIEISLTEFLTNIQKVIIDEILNYYKVIKPMDVKVILHSTIEFTIPNAPYSEYLEEYHQLKFTDNLKFEAIVEGDLDVLCDEIIDSFILKNKNGEIVLLLILRELNISDFSDETNNDVKNKEAVNETLHSEDVTLLKRIVEIILNEIKDKIDLVNLYKGNKLEFYKKLVETFNYLNKDYLVGFHIRRNWDKKSFGITNKFVRKYLSDTFHSVNEIKSRTKIPDTAVKNTKIYNWYGNPHWTFLIPIKYIDDIINDYLSS